MRIKVDISDLGKSQQYFNSLDERIQRGVDDGIKELSDRILEKLQENILLYGIINSGRLMDSISTTHTPNGVIVSCGVDYAMFVEFGTGVVGESNPHPKPDVDWVYDVNAHGDSGWWYPTVSGDPNPTKRVLSDGTLVAWTKGQESKPFMYKTWLWARQSATNIIRKNVRRALSDSRYN